MCDGLSMQRYLSLLLDCLLQWRDELNTISVYRWMV